MGAPMLGSRRSVPILAALALAAWTSTARADDPQPLPAAPAPAPAPPPAPAPLPAPARAPAPSAWAPSYTLNGYVETAYTYSFEKPSNGIIDYRGFDNRHNTFTIQNAVIDAAGKLGSLSARVALQVGRTPDTYYLAEPNLPGSAGTGASSLSTWRFIQQAYAGWKAPVARGLALEAGIFLSPIGLEGIAVKDNWNFSRSNLFFGLPFYHTGFRATLEVTERLALSMWVVNGWNNVVDNNAAKTILSQLTYKIPDRLLVSLLYDGGGERPTGAPEGTPWRHLVDGYAQGDLASWLSLAAHFDTGFERNRFGTSYWGAAAIYARVHPVSWLYLAARADRFGEHRATSAEGTASPIFFPASWVSSGTFTVEGKPHDNVSLRVEYRHDQAASDIYFAGQVKGDGTKTAYVPNAHAQNTMTLGATAWF